MLLSGYYFEMYVSFGLSVSLNLSLLSVDVF